MITLAEAAEQTGKSKSTLIRAIRKGKLSANRNEYGDYRLDPAELARVFTPVVTRHDEPHVASDTSQPMVADLLEMVKDRDSELADVRAELDDARDRLSEHREAARALMSPEDFDAKLAEVLSAEKAKQDVRAAEWKQSIEDRRLEIQQAKEEAERISEKAAADIAIVERRAAGERAIREALESRGLIARLLNRKPTPAG